MATTQLHVLKDADLSNNCPECFNQELKLSFYQKHLRTAFYHRITNEVTHELICKKCASTLYPVQWTEDIERVFEYYQKMVHPEKAIIRFNWLFYGLIGLILTIIVVLIFMIKNETLII